MRAIRVRAWVEVVGFVMKKFHFRVKWKCQKFISGATLREKRQACCQRANSKVLGPAVYKILQSSTKSRIRSRTVGRVTLTMKRNRGSVGISHDKAVALAACRQPGGCRRISYIGSERKNFVRKAGQRYKYLEEKSGSDALRPVEIPPLYRIWRTSPTYLCSSTSSWPMSRLYPVLCLDAISRLGKWAPGGIITFFIILYIINNTS